MRRGGLARRVDPASALLVDLALRTLPSRGELVAIGGPSVLSPKMAARRVVTVREDEALPFLHARAHAPVDAVMAAWPARFAPLMPFLAAARGALKPDGRALVLDLVWQTAPTPELLRVFAPTPGREKVRPVEGYEMQIEHSGFDIRERVDLDRARWTGSLAGEQRAAVEADSRRAARVLAWVLAPAEEEAGDG